MPTDPRTPEQVALPADIEADLTLAHADACTCGPGIWPTDRCGEVRALLRRSISAGMDEARLDGERVALSTVLNTAEESGVHEAFAWARNRRDNARACARAKATREGR